MGAPDCIFCKIASGQIPSLKVFEDEEVFAFLDIGPLADGHLLVIPKQHYERLDHMPPGAAGRLMQTLPQLGRALKTVAGVDAYNVLLNIGPDAGQVVMHVHTHLIPRRPGDGLGYRWAAKKYAPGQGEQLVQDFLQALRTA